MVVALVGLFYCGSKCQQETNERKWEAERSTPPLPDCPKRHFSDGLGAGFFCFYPDVWRGNVAGGPWFDPSSDP